MDNKKLIVSYKDEYINVENCLNNIDNECMICLSNNSLLIINN